MSGEDAKQDNKSTLLTLLYALDKLDIMPCGLAAMVASAADAHGCDQRAVTNAQIRDWVNEQTAGGQMDLLGSAKTEMSYAELADSEIDKRFK